MGGTAPSRVAVVVVAARAEAVADSAVAAVFSFSLPSGPIPNHPTRNLHPVGRVSIGPGCCITSLLLNLALLSTQ